MTDDQLRYGIRMALFFRMVTRPDPETQIHDAALASITHNMANWMHDIVATWMADHMDTDEIQGLVNEEIVNVEAIMTEMIQSNELRFVGTSAQEGKH